MLADLHQHASSSSCSLRTSRQVRIFMHDAQQQQLMLGDRSIDQRQHYEATLHFDGGARPNPGSGGWGFTLDDDYGSRLTSDCGSMEYRSTNNQSEYEGLIRGLKDAERHGIRRLLVKGDSELVIRQMTGQYRVTSVRCASC